MLQDLETALKQAGFSAAIRQTGGRQSPKAVAVELERDGQGRQRGLLLTLASSVMESMEAAGDFAPDEDDAGLGAGGVDFLQCYVALPFRVDESCFAATAQLIAHLNKGVPLMGFNMDAMTRTVYFRTMLIFDGNNLNVALVLEVVRTIAFLLSEFSIVLEAVATGQQSLDDALAALN